MQPEQSYQSHRRFHPLFHFVTLPILAGNVLVQIVLVVRTPSAIGVWDAIVAFALMSTAFLARYYGLRTQDRLIRLEETLRMQRVLPEEMRLRIPELRARHFIGLRYASDEELPALTRRVLDRELQTADDIKRNVKVWRPDYMRL